MPWVRKVSIDFVKKQATLTVVSKSYDEEALLQALRDAGFGGSVAQVPSKDKESAKVSGGAQVAFRVSGMLKTKSGAT